MRATANGLFKKIGSVFGIFALAALGVSTSDAEATPLWLQVSTGGVASCGIQVDNTLWCWGLIGRWYGTTSRGKSYDFGPTIYTPTKMSEDTDWQSVFVSSRIPASDGVAPACALKTDGSRYCWGDDPTFGVLGMGGPVTIDTNLEPQPAPDQVQFTQLSIGFTHSCGVTANNHLWCWGSNTFGQLGVQGLSTNPTDIQWSPRRVSAGNNWAFVTVGDYHTCALKLDGTRYCWGRNDHGQLGLADNFGDESIPTHRTNEGAWLSIAAGDSHTCGITSWGNLYCWGDNTYGQLGNNDEDWRGDAPIPSYHPVPERVAKKIDAGKWNDWQSLAPGGNATCGLRSGHRFCWVGLNDDENYFAVEAAHGLPVTLDAEQKKGTQWASLSVTGLIGPELKPHGCGIQLDGALWCWGSNWHGMVGVGDTNEDAVYGVPVRIDFVR